MQEDIDAKHASHFGKTIVDPSQKQALVDGVFSSVAGKYDLMNDVLSLGLHRYWKAAFVDMIPSSLPTIANDLGSSLHFLDLASGTGDIAGRILARFTNRKMHLTVSDINEDMLQLAGKNLSSWKKQASFQKINAEEIPLEDNSVSLVTIAFGLRNVTHLEKAIREAHRVLAPGGVFLCLEFSHVAIPLLDKLYALYKAKLMPKLGAWIARDQGAYVYLAQSINRFPNQEQLRGLFVQAGFACDYVNLSSGVVAIHKGRKQ